MPRSLFYPLENIMSRRTKKSITLGLMKAESTSGHPNLTKMEGGDLLIVHGENISLNVLVRTILFS